jgi:hypothetical protein
MPSERNEVGLRGPLTLLQSHRQVGPVEIVSRSELIVRAFTSANGVHQKKGYCESDFEKQRLTAHPQRSKKPPTLTFTALFSDEAQNAGSVLKLRTGVLEWRSACNCVRF